MLGECAPEQVTDMERRTCLDFNASTPLAPEVVGAMRPFLTEHYGNPPPLGRCTDQSGGGACARASRRAPQVRAG